MKFKASTRWALVALLGIFSTVAQAQIQNPSFETGDFTGWFWYEDGSSLVYVDTTPDNSCGTVLPSNGITDGSYAAYFSMNGPNHVALWQDFEVPPGGQLSVDLTYDSNSEDGFAFLGDFDYTALGTNQHLTIDVIDPAADFATTTPGDIYVTLLSTSGASPLTVNKQTLTADLSAYAGQTVRFRMAKVDNNGCFPAVLDNFSITRQAAPVPAFSRTALIMLVLLLGMVAAFGMHRKGLV